MKVATHADIAAFCGVSPASVHGWATYGMPGKTGEYDLGEIVRWLRLTGPWRQHAKPQANPLSEDDQLLAYEGDSPSLERLRLAKAKHAEYDLAEKEGSLLSRDKVRESLSRFASILRGLGTQLGRRFGNEALNLLNDSLEDCKNVIDNEFAAK